MRMVRIIERVREIKKAIIIKQKTSKNEIILLE